MKDKQAIFIIEAIDADKDLKKYSLIK